MNFLGWNDKLASHFFRPEAAGRQVFLFVTEELLDRLGAETGDTWLNFVSTVKAGHPWRPPGNLGLCQKALHCFQTWRQQERQIPAYIAYLGLFVLAAGMEWDDLPRNAYYPRLRRLIHEEGHGEVSGFTEMDQLWEGLERWATDERGGELGLFTYRRVGGWVHVGAPLAQTVLTEQERRALPAIYAAAQLDPTSCPSDLELRRALRTHGGQFFRSRTMNLLAGGYNEEAFLDVLLATAREELEEWDGHVELVDLPPERSVYGNLRLCAALDRVTQTARFTLRCSMNREFPAAGLSLTRQVSGEQFSCEGELLHWSTPLHHAGSPARVDGAGFDWNAGVELCEEHLGWRFRLQGSPVRLFLNGESEGVRGFVEGNQLTPGCPFVLAAHSDTWERLEAWGRDSCEKFERISVRQGLPTGWGLYRAAAARSDEQVRMDFPRLAFPSSIRLVVRGGICSTCRNAYFRFAAPALQMEGAPSDARVCCNGEELQAQDGVYRLPPTIPADVPLSVEVRRGAEVRRQSLLIVDDFEWRWSAPAQLFDRFGGSVDASEVEPAGVAGASLVGIPPPAPFFSPPPSCFTGRRVFLSDQCPAKSCPGQRKKCQPPGRRFGRCRWTSGGGPFTAGSTPTARRPARPGPPLSAAAKSANGRRCSGTGGSGSRPHRRAGRASCGIGIRRRLTVSTHDDHLLYVITARRELNWQAFRKVFDALYAQANLGGDGDEDVSHLRSRALRVLDWLGHCDVAARGETDCIFAAPPVLARLPVTGFVHAVLCGARSPCTAVVLRAACERHGCDLRIESQAHDGNMVWVPQRMALEAESGEALASIARDAGVACPDAPPACGLLDFSGSLNEYLQARPQVQAPELNWPRRDYDVQSLWFRPGGGEKEARLSVYEDPLRPSRLYCLWQGRAYREVERDWGRYAMLRQAGVDVLVYDPRRFILLVPSGAPLPRLLARACALCSGFAPAFAPRDVCSIASRERTGFHVFRAVPPVVAETAASKVCQRLTITALDAFAVEEPHD
jgi:hypothetical protein